MGKGQPGVMLYFDIRKSLKRLSTEEKGLLFEAILDYGESGLVPDFDGVIGVAWDFIQPRIDNDRERYLRTCEKRKNAAEARWEREKVAQMDAFASDASICIQKMPTSNTASTSASNPTSTATPNQTNKVDSSRLFEFGEKDAEEPLDFEAERRKKMGALAAYI